MSYVCRIAVLRLWDSMTYIFNCRASLPFNLTLGNIESKPAQESQVILELHGIATQKYEIVCRYCCVVKIVIIAVVS